MIESRCNLVSCCATSSKTFWEQKLLKSSQFGVSASRLDESHYYRVRSNYSRSFSRDARPLQNNNTLNTPQRLTKRALLMQASQCSANQFMTSTENTENETEATSISREEPEKHPGRKKPVLCKLTLQSICKGMSHIVSSLFF